MFFSLPQTGLIELEGEHSFPVVILSIIIACVASFTALSMNKRAQKNNFFHRNIWFVLASIAMGFGIWSMHFVGMSAFSLPIIMYYDPLLTIISIIPAMLASFLAFYIANRPRRLFWMYMIAGVFMGVGISTMHYVGMAAMKMDAIYMYDKWLFIASIAIAIVVSFVALLVFSVFQRYMENLFIQSVTAIIMGLAVSSMHYTGMMAISFHVTPDYTVAASDGVKMTFIAISVTVGMAILLGVLFLSSMIDRYVNYRTKYFDALTKLPNRRHFERKFAESTSKETLAIWHIHGLEKINREGGYLFGDEVLQDVSTLMMSLKPPIAELYRIEGNRFAFLAKGSVKGLGFQEAMERIAEKLREPLIFDDQEIVVPAVCAWLTAENQDEASKIYTNVLAVLNYPSIEYEHEVILYDPAIHTYTFDREIVHDVGRAMAEDELYLVYQPKINGRTYEVTGVETLLRWQHPTYGMLSPGVFIPILEKHNQMLDVTDWIIERTCRQISDWREEGILFGQVAINIPGEYVTSVRLLQVLKTTLKKYKLKPDQLELEITETSFMESIEEAIGAVSVFREEGFSVALDDFGTGVSSLSYLKRIPITTLKIDKSFVDGVPTSEKDTSIIQAIIALGNSFDLSIVFEGVETEEQAQFLASTCAQPIIQGYYFARPMKPAELIEWDQSFQHSPQPVL